ncbi:MAG: CoA transferase [Pseudomonadota bacterium]
MDPGGRVGRRVTARDQLKSLWHNAGLPNEALNHIELTGTDPVLPSSYRVGCLAQCSVAAAHLAAAEIFYLRNGQRPKVSVNMLAASLEFRSERMVRVDGGPAPELWDPIAGAYLCGDGRWVRIHTNFPHHRDGILAILNCPAEREAVALALKDWTGADFEEAASAAGMIAALLRSPEEWQAHAQSRAVAALPLVSIQKIDEAPPEPLGSGERPLQELRVLDLTRIIAGPVCGRVLASHGADVLRITSPHLPSVQTAVMDNGRGKLTAHLDLRRSENADRLRHLIKESDIFLQSYRPGALAKLGFAPQRLASLRPGIISLSLSAYGEEGPWGGKRGFDSIVQTVSGINFRESQAHQVDLAQEPPRALPCQALDHGSGFLLAFAAMVCLYRRATEGGSWHASVCLARTGQWLQEMGPLEKGMTCPEPTQQQIDSCLEEVPSGYGRLTAVRPSGRIGFGDLDLSPRMVRPSLPLGSNLAQWPPR